MAAFSKVVRPRAAGSYFNWESEARDAIPPNSGSVVAVPATADWGPVNTTVLLEEWAEFDLIFGSADTPLRRAVFGAFKGQGLAGKGGAGAVIAYRMATSAAAAATKVLNNTGAAAALTLTALHKGSRANAFRVTTQASATPGSTDLLIYDGTRLVESYTFPSTTLSVAAAAINTSSDFFSATVGTDGVALANVTASAFAGGNDGSSLTSADWVAMMSAMDTEQWSIIPAYGLTDTNLRAAFVAWIKDRNANGLRSMGVIGGAAAENLTTANLRSTGVNHWDIVNVGAADLFLDDLGVAATTAEFTVRVAGAIAARGEKRDMFFVRFADVSIVATLTPLEEDDAIAAGTTVFSRDTNRAAPVFIREGVTTYSNDSQSAVDQSGRKTHLVEHYCRIKNVRIQHGIELEINEWATSGDVLGELPNTEKAREIVLGRVKQAYQNREDAEIVQPGWTVVEDPSVPLSEDDDAVFYQHGFHPTRSLRQMFHTAKVG